MTISIGGGRILDDENQEFGIQFWILEFLLFGVIFLETIKHAIRYTYSQLFIFLLTDDMVGFYQSSVMQQSVNLIMYVMIHVIF